MGISMKKKKWISPLLTVVVRGRPEERVLDACKGPELGLPDMGNTICEMHDGCGYFCSDVVDS